MSSKTQSFDQEPPVRTIQKPTIINVFDKVFKIISNIINYAFYNFHFEISTTCIEPFFFPGKKGGRDGVEKGGKLSLKKKKFNTGS